MSLQSLDALLQLNLAHLINMLALLAACPAVWLLYLTRRRELRALKRLAALSEQAQIDEPIPMLDGPTLRRNRFYYRVGFACLGFALLLSWLSTRL